MRKIISFSCLVLFPLVLLAQQKMEIILRDGTPRVGIGKIKANKQIQFQNTEESKKEILDHKSVKEFTIYYEGGSNVYTYKVIQGSAGSGGVRLLEVIKTGNVNLYSSSSVLAPVSTGSGMTFSGASKTIYYISSKDSDIAINLKIGNIHSGRFQKIAKDFFDSCPELMQKIKYKKFKKYGIRSVVEFYNEKCKSQ